MSDAPPRVVIADDQTLVRGGFRLILGSAGIPVAAEAADGREAVAAVLKHRPDVVLMDIRMPEMDGLEATRRIRALGGDPARLPIIALSARVRPEDIEACCAAGMNDHIGKPFDRHQMYHVIDRWTAKR